MRNFPPSPERETNLLLLGNKGMSLEYATHTLTDKVQIRFSPRSIYFRLRAIPMIKGHWLIYLFKGFEKLVRIIREWWVLILLPLVPILVALVFVGYIVFGIDPKEI